jgi:hypothetical protein
MPVAEIQTSRIVDWETFYAVFQEVFRFPYGLTGMDGWIDYMSSVDDPGTVPSRRSTSLVQARY